VVYTTCFGIKMKLTLLTQWLSVLHDFQKETAIVSLSNIWRFVCLICRYIWEEIAQLDTWLATRFFVSPLNLSYRHRSLPASCLLHAKYKAAEEWNCTYIFQLIFDFAYWSFFLWCWIGKLYNIICKNVRAGIAQTAERLAKGWGVWGSNPSENEIFHALPICPWVPDNLLWKWVPGFFPGDKAAEVYWLPTSM
jgi:hypothetical protein